MIEECGLCLRETYRSRMANTRTVYPEYYAYLLRIKDVWIMRPIVREVAVEWQKVSMQTVENHKLTWETGKWTR